MDRIDYSRHYRNWHTDSAEHIKKMDRLYSQIIADHFPADKNASILDVGCGMGFLLLSLRNAGYGTLTGIDTDEEQVRSCQEKKLNVSLVQDSINYLNNSLSKFDIITAFDVLEHIPPSEQISFLKAINNALTPGGLVILTVPNANSVLASRNRYIDYTHHVLFTEVSLDFVLYNAGFKEINIQPLDYIISTASIKNIIQRVLLLYFRMRRRLEMMAELGAVWGRKIPLSFNIIAKAKK